MKTYRTLDVGNDKRSAEPLGIGDRILLTLNPFRMGMALACNNIGIPQVVAIALHAAFGQLKSIFFRLLRYKSIVIRFSVNNLP